LNHERFGAVQALSSRGWMHQGTMWKISSAAVPASVNKLAKKVCVCQACAAAELNPICVPQCELLAAVANWVKAQLERASSATAASPTQHETCPEVVCVAGWRDSRA